ncbi:hypothetical protein PUNSTDRAFT_116608 [Punctularia strigosozonata HHB-11173 SS5]|uniref:Uncharacterized protein n=1 Tax=Punctularia strigosozonata (strain HHB-11173) TaxID=741275 RepID=R7S4E2_PUNST|nr:uncharacterized protein PUNSTDRAFT_116608 [Punctularia strigosozonata HHB-11173 SS5]EIN04116.1 hypothetical protein PUNSTDRAFT_116608 [Punctularia strigosozonata HHB-11173 SS5]
MSRSETRSFASVAVETSDRIARKKASPSNTLRDRQRANKHERKTYLCTFSTQQVLHTTLPHPGNTPSPAPDASSSPAAPSARASASRSPRNFLLRPRLSVALAAVPSAPGGASWASSAPAPGKAAETRVGEGNAVAGGVGEYVRPGVGGSESGKPVHVREQTVHTERLQLTHSPLKTHIAHATTWPGRPTTWRWHDAHWVASRTTTPGCTFGFEFDGDDDVDRTSEPVRCEVACPARSSVSLRLLSGGLRYHAPLCMYASTKPLESLADRR